MDSMATPRSMFLAAPISSTANQAPLPVIRPGEEELREAVVAGQSRLLQGVRPPRRFLRALRRNGDGGLE